MTAGWRYCTDIMSKSLAPMGLLPFSSDIKAGCCCAQERMRLAMLTACCMRAVMLQEEFWCRHMQQRSHPNASPPHRQLKKVRAQVQACILSTRDWLQTTRPACKDLSRLCTKQNKVVYEVHIHIIADVLCEGKRHRNKSTCIRSCMGRMPSHKRVSPVVSEQVWVNKGESAHNCIGGSSSTHQL